MKTKFTIFIVVIVLLVVGLGVFMNSNRKPGKYDDFANALKSKGAVFYGAFWCPHCLAEKALFGSSKKYLPYVECSNPDRSSVKICTDEKIESYPSWKFKDGITLASKSKPTICSVGSSAKDEAPICAQVASQFYKTWIFPEYKFTIKSPADPVEKDGIWKFETDSQATGEIPLEFLAEQIGYSLPQ